MIRIYLGKDGSKVASLHPRVESSSTVSLERTATLLLIRQILLGATEGTTVKVPSIYKKARDGHKTFEFCNASKI